MLAGFLTLLLLPKQGKEIGELKPAGLLTVTRDSGVYCVRTDTGDSGYGENVEEALTDLEDTSDGTVYLDTARFLLIDTDAADALPRLTKKLRPTVSVCVLGCKPEEKEAYQYLSAHDPKTTILRLETEGIQLPVLKKEKGRFFLA